VIEISPQVARKSNFHNLVLDIVRQVAESNIINSIINDPNGAEARQVGPALRELWSPSLQLGATEDQRERFHRARKLIHVIRSGTHVPLPGKYIYSTNNRIRES
jgi:hypothetical protein